MLSKSHGPFVGGPAPIAHGGQQPSEHDERHPDEPSTSRHVERREQRRGSEPGSDEREGGAVPREEGPLVGTRTVDRVPRRASGWEAFGSASQPRFCKGRGCSTMPRVRRPTHMGSTCPFGTLSHLDATGWWTPRRPMSADPTPHQIHIPRGRTPPESIAANLLAPEIVVDVALSSRGTGG